MLFSEFFFYFFLFSSLLLWLETAIKGKITCSKYQTGSVLSERDPGKDKIGAKTEKEVQEKRGPLSCLHPLYGLSRLSSGILPLGVPTLSLFPQFP